MPNPFRSSPGVSLPSSITALLLALGVLAFDGAWLDLATTLDSRAAWMALIAALNAVAWLQITHTRHGALRALAAVLMTLVSIALGEWLVAALPIAQAMGQFPLETAHKMGPDFGWMLILLGNTPLDWLTVFVALMLAAWFGR
jgi:hypothetical protein